MILELKVKNFRSIKDWQSFTMLAENKVKEHEDTIFENASQNILGTAIIYGRNASGKSNILKAFRAIQYMVTESAEFKIDKEISAFEPFKLDRNCLKLPTELHLDFIAKDGIRYVYEIGFTSTKILYEILKFYPKSQPATLIERKCGEPIKYGEYLTGRKKTSKKNFTKINYFFQKLVPTN